jgi:predicted ATPase
VVVTATTLAVVSSFVGDSDRASAALHRACDRAAALPFPTGPFSQGWALCHAGWLTSLAGDFAQGLALQERMVEIGQRFGLVFWTVPCSFHAAISRAHLGGGDAAVAEAEDALVQWRAMGAEAFIPCAQTHLAEARLLVGRAHEALQLVDEAIASAEERGERFFLAESHRVRAAVLRRREGDSYEVRRALQASRAVAASQGALVFELRALTDLVEFGGPGADPADVEDLRRLLDRLPSTSRPVADADRARALLSVVPARRVP